MLLRTPPSAVMRTGMLFLVTGMLSLRFLPRWRGINVDLADGVSGLFYGLAIGTLLLSVWMRRRAAQG
jgi:hypothetical protein